MKFSVAIVFTLLITFSAAAQEKAPNDYIKAPTLTITGDFDGDGKQDTFTQFVTDGLGNKLDYIADTADWETTIPLYDREGYGNTFTVNGNLTEIDNYVAVGLLCLINMGDINATKGDEIAIVPMLLDHSNLNTCRIYSYCNSTWAEVFTISVNEMDFVYTGTVEPVYTTIPGRLEKRNGKWMYLDYGEWLNAEEPIEMKPLKVGSCE